MRFIFLSVGQGDSALMISPKGRAVLFDTGGSKNSNFDIGERVVVPTLSYLGINRLEAIFLTHAHEDHAAGTAGIMKNIPIKAVITAAEPLTEYAQSMKITPSDEILKKFRRGKAGEIYDIDGVKIEILASPEMPEGNMTGNEVSNVYKITYGKAGFLITGDMTSDGERN